MRQDFPQRVYTPNSVTHPTNPLIAEKLQFFTDSLKMMCLKSGEFYHYEIENHLSLINHLLFMIDAEIIRNNDSGMRHCFDQIKHLLKVHPLFSDKDLFITESEQKTEIKCKLQEISNVTSSNSELNNKLNTIRTNLVELNELAKPDYFKNIVKSISTKICCSHLLNHHKKHLYYLAKISFSYYYLNGYSRKLISSFADKIFKKRIDAVGHRIYFEGYLPFDLYQKQINNNRNGTEFNSELFDEIQSYIDGRTQLEQIAMLLHVLHYEKYEHKLLFRLDGIMTFSDRSNDELDVLGLKIYQTNDFKKKYDLYDYDSSKDFFHERQTAIVEITTNAFSQEDAVYQSIENLRNKLGRIMMLSNSRFSLSHIGYTFYPPEGETEFWINTMPEVGKISTYDIDELNYINEKLTASSNKEFYLELEQILQEAYIEDNITTSIHYFRKFVEFLFKNINECGVESNSGIPKEIRTIAYLLTYFEKKRFQTQIKQWVDNKLINSTQLPAELNGLANEYRKLVHNNNNPSFSLMQKYIAPVMQHTKYEANRAYKYSQNIDEKLVFQYYCRQLLFLKHYRDKHEHANITDDEIARKLGVYSYRILNRLLKDIFRVLVDDANISTSHKEILKTIVQSVKDRIVE